MALGNGFKTTAAKVPGKNPWAGVKSAAPRTPMLNIGHEYALEILSYEETRNPGTGTESYKVTVKVVDSDDDKIKNGSEAVVIFMKHGKALEAAMSKLKALSVAAAGFTSDEEYDAADPEGNYITNTFLGTGENLIGQQVHAQVIQGSPIKDKPGEYYQEFVWAPAPTA